MKWLWFKQAISWHLPFLFLYEIKVKKEEESKALPRFQLSKVISLHHVDNGELLPLAILMGVG